MSFGGDYGKDTGSYVSAVKDAIAAIVAAIPEITIKWCSRIHNPYYQSAQWVTCALSLSYPKKKIVLGKGLKIVHYQTFVKKHNQSQKRNEKKHKEI